MITDIVLTAIHAVESGHDLADDAPLQLDSLGFVELLVLLEKQIPGANLVGNVDLFTEGGPLETVGSLVAYLEEQDG